MRTGYLNSFESMGLVDGPGIRSVVFLQGCHLRCLYCHNPDTWNCKDYRQEITSEDLVKKLLRFREYYGQSGGVTISGGEPLLQMDFVTEVFSMLKDEGIHTCLDTAGVGYEGRAKYKSGPDEETRPNNEIRSDEESGLDEVTGPADDYDSRLRALLAVTDLVLLDVKHYKPEMYEKITGYRMDAYDHFLTILQQSGTPLWIRHVVVPGLTDGEESIMGLKRYISGLKNVERVELLSYHTMGVEKYEALGLPYRLAGVPALSQKELEPLEKLLREA